MCGVFMSQDGVVNLCTQQESIKMAAGFDMKVIRFHRSPSTFGVAILMYLLLMRVLLHTMTDGVIIPLVLAFIIMCVNGK